MNPAFIQIKYGISFVACWFKPFCIIKNIPLYMKLIIIQKIHMYVASYTDINV